MYYTLINYIVKWVFEKKREMVGVGEIAAREWQYAGDQSQLLLFDPCQGRQTCIAHVTPGFTGGYAYLTASRSVKTTRPKTQPVNE